MKREDATLQEVRIKPPRWEYVVLGLIVTGLIILGIIGSIVANQVKEPRRVSDRFVYGLLSKDAASAYELTAEPYKQSTSPLDFRVIMDDFNDTIRTQPKVSDYRIERSPADVLVATVEYEIPGTSNNRLLVKLIKENDNWRVLTINNLR
jgi:hypothetical protein